MRDFERLAAMAGSAEVHDRRLDGLIFKAIEEKEGDVWHDFGDEVWHRRDPKDHVAYDTPPAYTGSVDAARAAVPDGWQVAVRQESALWRVELSDPETGRRAESTGRTEAGARIAATLRARLIIEEEKQS